MTDGQVALSIVTGIMILLGAAAIITDKKKMYARESRIPNSALYALGFLMGGIGICFAQHALQHKTQRRFYLIIFPVLAAVNVIVFIAGMILLADKPEEQQSVLQLLSNNLQIDCKFDFSMI